MQVFFFFFNLKLCIKYKFIDLIINNIQLLLNLICVLKVERICNLAKISLDLVDLHWIWLGSLVESGGLDFECADWQSPNWIEFSSSVVRSLGWVRFGGSMDPPNYQILINPCRDGARTWS